MTKITSKKNKILIVGSFPNSNQKKIFGGQLTACKILINSKFSKKYRIYKLNSSFFTNPPPNLLIRSLFAGSRLLKFIYKIIINQPQIIIIFVADKLSAIEKGLLILVAKTFNKKVMIFPRAGALINQYMKNKIFKSLIKFTFSRSDIFLSQGKSFQKFAVEELKFSKLNAPVIPNWTSSSVYLSIGNNRKYQARNIIPKILFIGWLEEFKGVREILASALILKQKGYKFKLLLAGDGSYKKNAIEFIKNNKLDKYITLLGWIDKKKKNKILKEADIFLLPSWNEGFPNALIEAMSAGLAGIVSSVGTIPDFLTNEHNILLVRPKITEDIVLSIERLLNDYQLRKKIAQNGYLYAKANFTVDNGLELLSKEIKKLAT